MARRKKNVTGAETVERIFRSLPRKTAERVAWALNQGVEEIADRARVLAPVDEGDLRGTIETRPIKSFSRQLKSGTSIGVAAYAGVFFPSDAFYARWVEFGTAHGVPAQPFLFPAYLSVRRRVRGRIKREVKRAAKEVARGHRR